MATFALHGTATLLLLGGLHTIVFVFLLFVLPSPPALFPPGVLYSALFGLAQVLWVVPLGIWAVVRGDWGVLVGAAIVAVLTFGLSSLCWLGVAGAASA